MTTIFQKIPPDQIDNLEPQAIAYLENAIRRTPASTSRLDVTLDIAAKGYGNLYLIYRFTVLTGAAYILVYDTPQGKIVAPVLVGGDHMASWQADFYEFVQAFSRHCGAVKIRWIGRKGWGKAYPKSRVIGYIFEHAVEGVEDF